MSKNLHMAILYGSLLYNRLLNYIYCILFYYSLTESPVSEEQTASMSLTLQYVSVSDKQENQVTT